MERRISATEEPVHLDEVLQYVTEEQKPVIVECDGKPCAVIIAGEEYERLKAGQQQQRTPRTS